MSVQTRPAPAAGNPPALTAGPTPRAPDYQSANACAAVRSASFSAGDPIVTRTPPAASGKARTITL